MMETQPRTCSMKLDDELRAFLSNIVPPGKTKPLYFFTATNEWLAQVIVGDEWTTVYYSDPPLGKPRFKVKSKAEAVTYALNLAYTKHRTSTGHISVCSQHTVLHDSCPACYPGGF